MTARKRTLERLAASLTDRDCVVDAWTAKSFTDRLLLVELERGSEFPEELKATLRAHGLRGYNEVHDTGNTGAFAGELKRGDRYQFVDTESRGELQSYVVQ